MIVRYFLFVVVAFVACALCRTSMAAQLVCEKGALNMDLMTETFVPQDKYTAYIYGHLNTPNPNYAYRFTVKDDESGGMLRGVLSLYEQNYEDMEEEAQADADATQIDDAMQIDVPQVITPIQIRERIEVPRRITGLFIDVVKSFNWGDEYVEYYKIKFDGIDVTGQVPDGGKISVCLKPEMYK